MLFIIQFFASGVNDSFPDLSRGDRGIRERVECNGCTRPGTGGSRLPLGLRLNRTFEVAEVIENGWTDLRTLLLEFSRGECDDVIEP